MTLELNKVYNENCLETMQKIPDNSIDAIVTDPPYGLGKEPDALEMLRDWLETGHHDVKGRGFMGKEWDSFVPQPQIWKECLRILKPGGHLLSFAGTRTYDLVVLGLRISGFEIRDQFSWNFSMGFPKSLNISKAIDKQFGYESVYSDELTSALNNGAYVGDRYTEKRITKFGVVQDQPQKLIPQSDDAIRLSGWGTALKPAHEPIVLARKPLEGTVAQNVLKWDTGGLNIDGCRINVGEVISGGGNNFTSWRAAENRPVTQQRISSQCHAFGRFPSNFIHDGSDEVLELFPDSKGQQGDLKNHSREIESPNGIYGKQPPRHDAIARNDSGSAARFFYCAKATQTDRNEGVEHLELKKQIGHNRFDKCANCGGFLLQNPDRPSACKCENPEREDNVITGNHHPTVKPISLMRYLCRLITPPDGIIYDPFAGSGSTGKAAILENFKFIGSDLDAEYTEISNARIKYAIDHKDELSEKYVLDHIESKIPKSNTQISNDNYF